MIVFVFVYYQCLRVMFVWYINEDVLVMVFFLDVSMFLFFDLVFVVLVRIVVFWFVLMLVIVIYFSVEYGCICVVGYVCNVCLLVYLKIVLLCLFGVVGLDMMVMVEVIIDLL